MKFSPAASTARFGGLDGLRAIAVALVLFYHFFPQLLPGGFLGVDIFFVISGFLITSLLIREKAKHGRVSLGAFWRRRARRLLPALGLVLLVCTSLAAFVGGDLLVGIGRQVLGAAAFVSNWVFVAAGSDYFARDTPELFRNTWSLAIEEQFYIFLPLIAILLFAVCRRQTAVLLLAIAGAASALWMAWLSSTGANPTRVYFGSDTHSFGLMLGAALAFATSYSRSPAYPGWARQLSYSVVALGGFGVLGVMAFTLPEGSVLSFQGGFQLATVVALATVWAVTRPGAWIGRPIDVAPMRWVGERSYGIYLWHWPLLLIISGAFPSAAQWQVALVTLAATLLLAAASFRWVEQPVRQLGIRASLRLLLQPRRYTPKRRFVAIGLGTVLAVSIPATAYAMSQAPAQSSAQAAVERGAELVKQNQTASEQVPAQPAPAAPQRPEPAPAKGKQAALPAVPRATGTDMTAVGDSVMLASAPELTSAFPGVSIDAAVSRGMGAGVGIVADAAAQGALRHVVVVGLGTNGTVTNDELTAILNSAAGRSLILVNAYGDREWIPGVNETITSFAETHRGVVVADWDGKVAGVPGALAGDEIHPNPSGGVIYAESVQAALDALDTPAEAVGYAVPRR